jgi:hypothetical protein
MIRWTGKAIAMWGGRSYLGIPPGAPGVGGGEGPEPIQLALELPAELERVRTPEGWLASRVPPGVDW